MVKRAYLGLLCLLCSTGLFAQFPTGDPGQPILQKTVQINKYLSIDLGSLNKTLSFPIHSKGVGPVPMSAYYVLNEEPFANSSSNWSNLSIQPNQYQGEWGPTIGISNYPMGDLSFTNTSSTCPGSGGPTTIWQFLGIVDTFRTSHPINVSWDSANCLYPASTTQAAQDLSGFQISVSGSSVPTVKIYNKSGFSSSVTFDASFRPYKYASVKDTNGNTYTVTEGTSSPFTVNFTDPLITTTNWLTFPDPTRSTPGAINTPKYHDGGGTLQAVTPAISSHTFNPWFSCSGITAGSSTQYFMTKLTYPDTSDIVAMTWENQGGTKWSGRLGSITIPEGAVYTMAYSGGTNNGIWCPTGGQPTSNATLNITATPVGVDAGPWTFARTWVNTANVQSQTVATWPNGGKSTIQFTQDFPTSEVDTDTDGVTTLKTTTWCYQGHAYPCTSQYPISISGGVTVDVYNVYPGITTADGGGSCSISGCPNRTTTTYDTYGNVTEVDRYGYGPVLLSKTITKMGTWTGSACDNSTLSANFIQDRVCEVDVENGAGSIYATTRFDYNTTNGNMLHKYSYTSGTSVYLTTTYSYNTNGTLASVQTPDLGLDSYTYGNCNSFVKSAVSHGSTTATIGSESFSYNCDLGVMTSYSDMNSLTLSYTYGDPLGRLTQITDNQSSPATNFTYVNPNETDSDFNDTTNGYDQFHATIYNFTGRVVTSADKNGSSYDMTQYLYDNRGNVRQVSVPCNGSSYTTPCTFTAAKDMTYDGLNRLTLQHIYATAGTATRTNTYTGGDFLSVLSPAPTGENNKQVQIESDGLGRVVSICQGTTSLPGSGNCNQRATASGYLTSFTYDPASRLLTKTVCAQSGCSVIQQWSYTHDALGRVTQKVDPMSGTTNYTYDAVGSSCSGVYTGWPTNNLGGHISEADDQRGNHICYGYEATGNRLGFSQVLGTDPDNYHSSRFYTYDGSTSGCNLLGRLSQTDSNGSGNYDAPQHYFCYDAYGRTTYVTEQQNGINNTTLTSTQNASYFPNGALKSLTVPNNLGLSGINVQENTINYTLDSKGRAYTVKDATETVNIVNHVTYDAQNRPTNITYGNGSGGADGDSDTYTYDAVYGVTNYTFNVALGSKSDSTTLTLNANGSLNQTVRSSTVNSGDSMTCTFTHDDILQLLTHNCGTKFNTTYSYDKYGNVTSSGSSIFNPGYNATNNRELTSGIAYDADGRITTDPTTSSTFAYNAFNQIVNGPSSWKNINYDALGIMDGRIASTNNGNCGSADQLGVESPVGLLGWQNCGNGKAVSVRVPLPGGNSYIFDTITTSRKLAHMDHTGSARLLVNFAADTLNSHCNFGPFGENFTCSAANLNVDWNGKIQELQNGYYGNDAQMPQRKRTTTPPYDMNNSPF